MRQLLQNLIGNALKFGKTSKKVYSDLETLQADLDEWVDHYNYERYHESLDNVTPADVHEVRRNDILDQCALVKARTMTKRKIHNQRLAG